MASDVANDWNIDASRQLLTGMSDGGTFTYVVGLRGDCQFTHLAPVAASFHPMLMPFADADRIRGLPVHIVHGTQDWMFPPEMAQGAERTLRLAGADVVQCASAFMRHGRDYATKLIADLQEWGDDAGFASVAEFRGKLAIPWQVDSKEYQRDGYVSALQVARRAYVWK